MWVRSIGSVVAAVVFAVVMSLPVRAAEVAVGALAEGDTVALAYVGPNGTIVDNYTFSLSSGSAIEAFITFPNASEPVLAHGPNNFNLRLFAASDLVTPIATATRTGQTFNLAVSGLSTGVDYVLRATFTGGTNGIYNGQLAVVPLPPAFLLLASALMTLVLFGRLRRKTTA